MTSYRFAAPEQGGQHGWMTRPVQTDSLSVKRSKAERTDRTRNRIIDAARLLFTKKGFLGTGTEELIRNARTSRGALYHHFRDKEDVFCAVFEPVQGCWQPARGLSFK
jgi:AcrR family transcriptional regulator